MSERTHYDYHEHGNARLIAAAPDLYEACKAQEELIDAMHKLLACYRVQRRPSNKTLDGVAKSDSVQMMARAAIAKADGENV